MISSPWKNCAPARDLINRMAEEPDHQPQRRQKRRTVRCEHDYGPPPPEVHPSIRNLRGSHRAAHPDMNVVLETTSHLLMAREWPIICSRFMDGLRMIGLDCVSKMQYIRLDQHLLTALVERWSSKTNTFHLPVGEMTITLQDVAMILGVKVDGPAFIGSIVIGEGKRWLSWPACCDALLGEHPEEDVVYQDPINHNIQTKFKMGQAKSKTCVPLRWSRWRFCRDSYVGLTELQYHRHLRAYVLYILRCFLLPDTSGSEIHLQYLPLMEDLQLFSTYSLGGAVLAHLYRELHESTRPTRVKIAGCLHLLQVWSWEHLHVGRPTLHVPYPQELHGLSVGSRWNEDYVREMPPANLRMYRDELDGLLDTQVTWEPYEDEIINRIADICLAGIHIWRCRAPLISWKRVEWHLPDRVIRRFGLLPITNPLPMDPTFERKDGRGKGDVDWVEFQQKYIALWDNMRSFISSGYEGLLDRKRAIRSYMRWYYSWASLFLLTTPEEPPRTYYSKAPVERAYRNYFLNSEKLLKPLFGRTDDSPFQAIVNNLEQLGKDLRRQLHICDTRYHVDEEDSFGGHDSTMEAGPSTYQEQAPSSSQWQHILQDSAGVQLYDYAGPSYEMGLEQSPTAFVGAPEEQEPGSGGVQMYDHAGPSHELVLEQDPAAYAEAPSEQEPVHDYGMPAHELGLEQDPVVFEEYTVHDLRQRPLRAPDTYTPGSKAIPRRGRGRRD